MNSKTVQKHKGRTKDGRGGSKSEKRGKGGAKPRPEGYYQKIERRRKGEGKRVRLGIQRVSKDLEEMLRGTKHEKDAPMIVCLLDMEFRGHSYRGHVAYMDAHPELLNMYGLTRERGKSCLHDWARKLAAMMEDENLFDDMLLKQAGKAAKGTLLCDSTGMSIMLYEDWEDAKKGIVSKRKFAKLHIVVAPKGRIVACCVTRGQDHDSPVFRKMMRVVPYGDGYVILDKAYDAYKNCEIIRASGRRPVIVPKNGYVKKGYNARADMIRWYESDPDGFMELYHQRNLVESAFSSMKARFSAIVRAKSLPMQQLRLTLRCICYNLVN